MSSPNAADETITNWLMAGLCLGGVAALLWFVPMTWVLDPDSPDFNPVVLIPVVGTVAGVYSLFLAIRGTRRNRRYGVSALRLERGEEEDGSVRMGASLRGRIVPAQPLRPTGELRVALQCVDTHQFRQGHGARTYGEEFVVWEQAVTLAPGDLAADGSIPFSFRLPKQVVPPEEDERAAPGTASFSFALSWGLPFGRKRLLRRGVPPKSRKWRIAASAPMPGIDYEEYFILYVR